MTDLLIVSLIVALALAIMWVAWFCCDAMNMGEADGQAGSRFHQDRVYSALMPLYEMGRATGIARARANMIGAGNE